MSFVGVEKETNAFIFASDNCYKAYMDTKEGKYKRSIDENVYDGYFDETRNEFYPKFLDIEVYNYYGDVPQDILDTKDKWCYSDIAGFYINPNWRNDDVDDDVMNQGIMDAIEELAFRMAALEGGE